MEKFWSPDHKFWSPTYKLHIKNTILYGSLHTKKATIEEQKQLQTSYQCSQVIRLWFKGDGCLHGNLK